VSIASEPELVKNTWPRPAGASAAMRSARRNAAGWPIENEAAKSSSPAWRRIASTMRGRPWPAFTHHSVARPSSTCRPSAVVKYMSFAAVTSFGFALKRRLSVNGIQ
jgi:hypothetical protein